MELLQGKWKNQLDSVVELIPQNDGSLIGNYHTAVSRKGEPLPPTPINGRWQLTPQGVLCGFVAQWNYSKDGVEKYSTTSWSGRIVKENSNEIRTTWLLTSSDQPDWNSTTINKDTFNRVE